MTIIRADNQDIVFSHADAVQVRATCDSASNTFVITPGAGVQGPEVSDVEIQAITCSYTLQDGT